MNKIWVFVILGIMYTIATIISIYVEELTAAAYFLAGIIGCSCSFVYLRDA